MKTPGPLARYFAALRWDAPGAALRRVVLDVLTLVGGVVAVVLLVCLAVWGVASVAQVVGGC